MEVLMPVTRQKTSEEWINILNAAGVPCGPIYTIDKSFADPQVKFLEMAQPVHSNALGDLTILGHPVGWNGQRNPLRSAAPELGEHNEEVFTALGFTKAEIDDLAKREII
jgi:formyl-CoA transferase